ncbi:MAG: hypothetical protein MRY63_08045 [Neomegalonema sp.]|nr:hypothetical protein [Neomegalonema sp.]
MPVCVALNGLVIPIFTLLSEDDRKSQLSAPGVRPQVPPEPGHADQPEAILSVIFQESFETDGQGVRYTASAEFQTSGHDHFGRTDGSNIFNQLGLYGNVDGDYLWAGEDIRPTSSAGEAIQTIDFGTYDTLGLNELTFSGLFAVGNYQTGSAAWDRDDYMAVLYSLDGGVTFEVGMLFRSEVNRDGTNESLGLVEDLVLQPGVTSQMLADELRDADGDGDIDLWSLTHSSSTAESRLSKTLTEYSFQIPQSESVQIMLAFHSDFSSEEFGVDNITFTGEIATPTNDDDVILGSNYDDKVNLLSGNDIAYGRGGDDWLIGARGEDQLYGDEGNDVLTGLSENDILYGGTGNDRMYGGIDDDQLYGEDGNDTLSGEAGIDHLDGGEGHDRLLGGAGDDMLIGGAGNDRMWGERGIDMYDGGEGSDIYYLEDGENHTNITDSGGTERVFIEDGIGVDFDMAEDQLESFYGSDAGADTVTAYGLDVSAYIDGRGGNDSLTGSSHDDEIQGGAGNDTLIGGLGNDVLDGGEGNDIVWLAGAADDYQVVFADNGDMTITNLLTGEIDIVRNVEGLEFDAGAILYGTEEADLAYGSDNADIGNFLGGNDRVLAGEGDDEIFGGAGADTLLGQGGDDRLEGGEDADRLFGGDGSDMLIGGSGNDRMWGEGGVDYFDGGDGADTYYLNNGENHANITEGDGRDKVYIEDQIGVTFNMGEDQIESFYGSDGGDDTASADGLMRAGILDGRGGNDTLTASSFGSSLIGGTGDDLLIGGTGVDSFDGGEGADIAVFTGERAAFSISDLGSGRFEVEDLRTNTVDTVFAVETLRFDDADVLI